MASKTIQQLTELSASPDASDAYVIVDVSDTTMAATGTNKKVTHTNAFGTFLTDLTGLSVGALSDVDLTGNADTYALLWDNTAGEWQPGPIVSPTGEVDFVASGTIANGDRVRLLADGKVEVIAGTAAGFGTAVGFEVGQLDWDYTDAAYDSATNRVVIVYRDSGNSSYGTAIVGTVSGTSISFGTAVVFESATTAHIAITFDEGTGKVVIAYVDGGNSSYGTAVVGTVSGTSISFGTPVVFESAISQHISITYDSTAAKVVIVNSDFGNSSYGTAIVGTVSGTSISFGTAVVFESASTSQTTATFDSTLDKVVIAYRDVGNTNYGTAIVGTVSGTSISFGTAVVFESATTATPNITFDSSAGKVVVVYTDTGNSSYGTGIVGTVSGTSISFGTAVVFESAAIADADCYFHNETGVIGIAYKDAGNSDYGTAIVGTVSGTAISYGAASVFASVHARYIGTIYDSTNKKIVIVYTDTDNTNYGTAIVWQPVDSIDNQAYLGIAKAAISDTATGSIVIDGGIATNQSGLTPGQLYYVDVDGTLTTTDTGVVAGKAYSATDLQVFT